LRLAGREVNRDALTTAVCCMCSVLSSASTFESQLIRDLEACRAEYARSLEAYS